MKKKELYRHLTEIANKISMRISEQNLKVTGVNAKSGLCRVKGEPVLIIDKRLTLSEKIRLLGNTLKLFSLDDVYIAPAVREFLDEFSMSDTQNVQTGVGKRDDVS